MLSSPRKPVSTMRIFSSAENCLRVARRISFTTCSAASFTGPDFCPICAPSMATMGQKSSLPQLTRSVSVVLMPDTDWCRTEVSALDGAELAPASSRLIASIAPVHDPQPARHDPHHLQREIGVMRDQRQKLRGVDLRQLGMRAGDHRGTATG